MPIGSRGVIFIPYLAGRGTPKADYGARGGFVRVGIEHGRAELTRAVLEGVAYVLKDVYDEFKRQNLLIGNIRLTGGGARSHIWRQMIADVLQQPVIYAGVDATLGNAMISAVGLGLYVNLESTADAMVQPIAREEPRLENSARYEILSKTHTKIRELAISIPRYQSNEQIS